MRKKQTCWKEKEKRIWDMQINTLPWTNSVKAGVRMPKYKPKRTCHEESWSCTHESSCRCLRRWITLLVGPRSFVLHKLTLGIKYLIDNNNNNVYKMSLVFTCEMTKNTTPNTLYHFRGFKASHLASAVIPKVLLLQALGHTCQLHGDIWGSLRCLKWHLNSPDGHGARK